MGLEGGRERIQCWIKHLLHSLEGALASFPPRWPSLTIEGVTIKPPCRRCCV
jgi:hypothetical protein